MKTLPSFLDPATAHATKSFIRRVEHSYSIEQVILFGSRARQMAQSDSDADLAIVLPGQVGKRVQMTIEMAEIAFDIFLDTGILIQALPLWHNEFEHPEQFSNPALIDNIRREGVRLH